MVAVPFCLYVIVLQGDDPCVMPKKAKNEAAKPKGRGVRYTPAQKAKILAYVNEVNAKKGRGGAAAASRKFGISQITIGQWIKKSAAPATKTSGAKRGPKPGSKRGRKPAATKAGSGFAATLRRLADVHEAIAQKKAELAELEEEYKSLKKSL